MTNDELMARAQRAEKLLLSEEWTDAWGLYRARLFDQMEHAKDDADALAARRMLMAANEARRELERMIADGAMAADDANQAQRSHDLQRLFGVLPKF